MTGQLKADAEKWQVILQVGVDEDGTVLTRLDHSPKNLRLEGTDAWLTLDLDVLFRRLHPYAGKELACVLKNKRDDLKLDFDRTNREPPDE